MLRSPRLRRKKLSGGGIRNPAIWLMDHITRAILYRRSSSTLARKPSTAGSDLDPFQQSEQIGIGIGKHPSKMHGDKDVNFMARWQGE